MAFMMALAPLSARNNGRGAEIIAHRGYWKAEGATQNSRAALQAAVDLNLYGSETDIWLTKDGRLMVNHDPEFKGVTIKDATSRDCRKLILSNGETMPELDELLAIMQKAPTGCRTKLIIEIKDHGEDELNRRAATATLKAVREAKAEEKVEYISFSDVVCRQLIAEAPAACVAYLTGGVTPQELKEKGYTGLDYHMNEFRNNPHWVKEAQELGMTVNVWTVTSPEDLMETMERNVDFITTDDPLKALAVKEEISKK